MNTKFNSSFNHLWNIRKKFLDSHTNDHVLQLTNSNVLISAPHGVSQIRLGKYKHAELGTIPTAVSLAKATNSSIIIKTANNNDDANFNEICPYRTDIESAIKANNIKYLIDVHGLAKKRPCDINLGINFGQNIKPNESLFFKLKEALEANNFSVSIDEPFCGGPQTIAGSFAKKCKIWTIQIEINCKITNEPQNIQKYNQLLTVLAAWINSI